MNNYIKNNITNILKYFLYLQPIIDLVTSLSINLLNISISIGPIIRFIFLVFLLYYYLIIKKDKESKIPLLLILGYIMAFSVMIITIKDISVLSFELSNILKIYYLLVLLIILRKEDVNINYLDLVKVSLIYMFFVAIPDIFKISFSSYTQGKEGSIGWFNSANEISAILSILCPFVIYYIFTDHNFFKKLFILILTIYTYLVIGSKIVIISLIVSFIFNIYLYIKNKKINKQQASFLIIMLLIMFVVGLFLLPRTNFYQNIRIHLSFLGFSSVKEMFSFNFLNRFIFSDRLTYLSGTNLNFIWSKPIEKILGLGFIESYGTDYVYIKSIEMDFFEIFYRTGIIGFFIYIVPFIKKFKEKVFVKTVIDLEKIIKFSSILGLAIAFLVGHTLISPAVAIYIVYIINMNRNLSDIK